MYTGQVCLPGIFFTISEQTQAEEGTWLCLVQGPEVEGCSKVRPKML